MPGGGDRINPRARISQKWVPVLRSKYAQNIDWRAFSSPENARHKAAL
jgi:hypothetical protein